MRADFVAHRKVVNADYLRRQVDEGVYDAKIVEEVIEAGGRGETRTDFEATLNPNAYNYRQGRGGSRRPSRSLSCMSAIGRAMSMTTGGWRT